VSQRNVREWSAGGKITIVIKDRKKDVEIEERENLFCFLDRAFSIMTKINQQNAQINSGLTYY